MKICILSDSHDHRGLLRAAGEDARARGAAAVLHCGDVVAPSTLWGLTPLGLPVHVIHGNNAGDVYNMAKFAHESGSVVHYHGMDAALTLAGRRVFLVHFPHYAHAMACTGDWDLVCCGHDHQPEVREVRNLAGRTTVLVNPGSVAGIGHPATYVLGDLEKLHFEIIPVPG